jgi:vitamin B12 transporter
MFSKGLAAIIFAAVLAFPAGDAMAQAGADVSGSSDLLGTVVVSASRSAEQLRSVSGNVTVVTAQQIEARGDNDLGDVLKHEGFWMVDFGASKLIQIRGIVQASHENTQLQTMVLVLVNGRRTGVKEANQLSMDNVERIEIIRGPGAVQYGSSALGGVINVITKRGEKDTFTAVVEEGIGSFDLYKSHIAFSGGYGAFDFSGSYTYLEHGDIELKGGTVFPYTSSRRKSMMLDIGYTFLDRHRIGLNYAYSSMEDEWPAVGYREYLDILAAGGNIDGDYGIYKPHITTLGFTYDGSTDSGTFDWSLFYSQTKYRRPSENYSSSFGDSKNFTNQDIRNYGASLGFNSKYLDADLGFDYISYQIDGEWDGRFYSRDIGFYLASKIKLLDDSLFFNIGGRFDKFHFASYSSDSPSRSKSKFSPSFGVAYLPVEWLKLRANYAVGMKMPTSFQYVGGTTQGYTYFPNPALQPEETKTIEFGVDVDYKFFSSSLTYFHTDYKNKIDDWYDYVRGGTMYINIEGAVIAGFELSMRADLGEAFDLGFSLLPHLDFTYMTKSKTRSNERLVNGSDDLAFVPKWTLAWGITLNHPGIDLMADLTAVHYGNIVNNYTYPPPGETFNQKPGLVTVDLSVEKGLFDIGSDGKFGKVKLRVEVKNMFDNHNEIYYDFPGPGRNFYVGLKYVY